MVAREVLTFRNGGETVRPRHAVCTAARDPQQSSTKSACRNAASCGLSDAHIDFIPDDGNIDRLGQESVGAIGQRFAPGVGIAIGGDHDYGNVRSCRLRRPYENEGLRRCWGLLRFGSGERGSKAAGADDGSPAN